MRVVMTGADDFLGWCTRMRILALTDHEVVSVDVGNWDSLRELVGSADAVLHFASINRASDRKVDDGNADLARHLADAVRSAPDAPAIMYANTIQVGTGTPYETGKATSNRELFRAGRELPGLNLIPSCGVGRLETRRCHESEWPMRIVVNDIAASSGEALTILVRVHQSLPFQQTIKPFQQTIKFSGRRRAASARVVEDSLTLASQRRAHRTPQPNRATALSKEQWWRL